MARLRQCGLILYARSPDEPARLPDTPRQIFGEDIDQFVAAAVVLAQP
jgi:hypothetical protein